MAVRRAKIVCTLGPATDTKEGIRGLIEAGMDVARLNFSHGAHEEHAGRAELIRSESEALGKPVALLQDLCGPKIRTGPTGPGLLEAGDDIDLVAGNEGDERTIAIDYDSLADDVQAGDRILLGDGQIELRVSGGQGERVQARVEHGGIVKARMGVNLPSQRVKLRALTDKDKQDLEFGLSMGLDYVALSFVRTAEDIHELRALCESHGYPVPIIAKIETPQAVEQIDAICDAADAVMVARGDLGVELPPEMVPVIQKQIIGTGRIHHKPVIVATEMLQSMVDLPRPTRAEASDVAGAVFGGADAVMLSAETATGAYPLIACRMMHRIICEAESSQFFNPVGSTPSHATPEAIAGAACEVARVVGARLIVALTESGGTARLVSKARSGVPIVAFSPDTKTLRRAALYWGVDPRSGEVSPDIDQVVKETSELLSRGGLIAPGDRYVMVYGAPMGVRGSTNAVRVEQLV